MKEKLFAPFKSNAGESLAETLVALLIIVLALLMLPSAIMASARVNAKAEEMTSFCSRETDNKQLANTITIDIDGYSSDTINVSIYEDDGFYFYEYDN